MTKKNRRTPPEVYAEVCVRSGGEILGGRCIGGACEDCQNLNLDWRGLQFSHDKHRQMGGTVNPEVHNAANIFRRCGYCHDLKDKRVFEV